MQVAEVLKIKGLQADPAQENIKSGAGKLISRSKIPDMQQKIVSKSIEIETKTELIDDTDIELSEETVTDSIRIISEPSLNNLESLDKEIYSLVQTTEKKASIAKYVQST